MSIPRFFGLTAAFLGFAALAASACGDDNAIVRERLDGSLTAFDGSGEGGLACGVAIPDTFVAPNFAANAAVELSFAQGILALDAAMQATEGTSMTTATAADLNVLYNSGSPSLRSVSTSAAQSTVDAYLVAFGAAGGKTWQPSDALQDGGAPAGGKYSALFYESPIGVDIRSATGKTLLGGALFNHVLGLVAGPVTDATVDQLLAAFGASQALANRTDVDAGANGDRLVAELASKRDDKTSAMPGIYRKIRTALLTMKAAVAAPDNKCKTELDAAVATYLLEWEHATYASAIYSLNLAATSAIDPTKGAITLHAFGDALGLIQSFKGLDAQKRKISDAQIDIVLGQIGADSPFQLVTDPGTRAMTLTNAINNIAFFEGFDPASIEPFKKSF